jgi:hypothetical protein
VPGILVLGLGHYAAGEGRTARRLLILEGIALGTIVVAGAGLGLSGASRRLSLPIVPMLIGGSGLFLTGWAADIYGAAGGPRIAGPPPARLPGLEARLGYTFVTDPQFAYSHFTDMAMHVRHGAWRTGAHAQLAMDDDNQRVRGQVAYRFTGPRRHGQARDGSAFDLQGGLTWHRYGSNGFTSIAGDLLASGRYDLARMAPTLAGSFVEAGLGLGLELTAYAADGAIDASDLLLAHFAFGIYLGTPEAMHGEVRIGYDHRRDELPGGLAVPGGSNGYLGNFGADGFLVFGPRWGVAAHVRAGSAYLAGASLIYRKE